MLKATNDSTHDVNRNESDQLNNSKQYDSSLFLEPPPITVDSVLEIGKSAETAEIESKHELHAMDDDDDHLPEIHGPRQSEGRRTPYKSSAKSSLGHNSNKD